MRRCGAACSSALLAWWLHIRASLGAAEPPQGWWGPLLHLEHECGWLAHGATRTQLMRTVARSQADARGRTGQLKWRWTSTALPVSHATTVVPCSDRNAIRGGGILLSVQHLMIKENKRREGDTGHSNPPLPVRPLRWFAACVDPSAVTAVTNAVAAAGERCQGFLQTTRRPPLPQRGPGERWRQNYPRSLATSPPVDLRATMRYDGQINHSGSDCRGFFLVLCLCFQYVIKVCSVFLDSRHTRV